VSVNLGIQIQILMRRAHRSIRDAELLAQDDSWDASVNRLYYACFYAVSALLLREGRASNKHTGIRSLFNRHFVRTGRVSKDMGVLYNDLFENRHDADYIYYISFDEDRVRPWIDSARQFVGRIEELLQA
jgi:uncharacterized protein (UPF0332 family)